MADSYEDIPESADEGSSLLVKQQKDIMDKLEGPPPTRELTTEVWINSIGYMAAMGVCGTVLVALGSTLEELAENVGKTSTEVGTVFIARGAGAIFGAVFSAKLYQWFKGNYVMSGALLFLTLLLAALPFNTSDALLHLCFFFLGLGTAITDTGCQIMTRKIHGKTAGPWLGANTVAFGISGAFVPLIEIFTSSLYIQYGIIAGVVFVTTLVIVGGPNPEAEGKIGNGPPVDSTGKKIIPHYNVEIVIGLMVFCFIGGKVTATAYLETYIEDTGVISTSKEADAVLVLWIAITIGRLAGVYDQRFLTNRSLPVHLSILCVGGTLAMLMMLWFPNSSEAFWIGVAAYGLFNGPCVGYCYDWNNRITYPTEKSMSIVMFGLNFGASLVPYITTLIWDAGGGPTTMTVVIFLSMFIPLPLLHMTKFLSYDPAVNPTMKHVYNSIPASEDDVDAEVGLEEPKRS